MHYYTQHAAFGAFASFTLGLPGKGGGFGQSLGAPAGQDLHIGWRVEGGQWNLLPFFGGATGDGEEAFTGTANPDSGARPRHNVLGTQDYRRELQWASERITTGPLGLTLYSPFGDTPRPDTLPLPEARFLLAPVVCATLEADNSAGDRPLELVFGYAEPARPPRPLADTNPALAGFATGAAYGFATDPSPDVSLVQSFTGWKSNYRDHRGLHLLGQCAHLRFNVPPRSKRSFRLALGFFRDGRVTTGIEAWFYYTHVFRDLEDVLAHGLAEHARYIVRAEERNRELLASSLNADQRWLLSQAPHSYLGSTELLTTERAPAHPGGAPLPQPLWVVNEGEYRMMNTFDLTVDHLFFELRWFPWAIRDTLDLFVSRYSYTDTLHSGSDSGKPVGLSFTHDMGVTDQFTVAGTSSYERTDLKGCFSHMTAEQLVNWICCACTYAEYTLDTGWLGKHAKTLLACAESLLNRDHPDPASRDGLMKWDSDRCGMHGAEITTYDSLDISLGQARNNLYLAVKTLAAWHLLERAFKRLGLLDEHTAAVSAADRLAATLLSKFESDTGMFPAVFEAGNQSRLIPAIEGLVFPVFLGWADEVQSRHTALFKALGTHLRNVLKPGVCIDTVSGAWKLSSTSHNTWYSKIAISQHVARKLFPDSITPEAAAADAVHARFQQSTPLGRFAMVDQVHSETGADLGSRYYPRVVTACLWLT
jgi:hypothetical protein